MRHSRYNAITMQEVLPEGRRPPHRMRTPLDIGAAGQVYRRSKSNGAFLPLAAFAEVVCGSRLWPQ